LAISVELRRLGWAGLQSVSFCGDRRLEINDGVTEIASEPDDKACCTPQRGEAGAKVQASTAGPAISGASRDVVSIPGGAAMVGTRDPQLPVDGEGPLKSRRISEFLCERGAVTTEQFVQFIADTGYQTEAETFGWSFVFYQDVPESTGPTEGISGHEWWRKVEGATWQLPHGPDGAPAKDDHPVVHVSWHDAVAYAEWTGGRLPTEAEWEHAARGGLGDVRFPWGADEPDDVSQFPCNIWQGNFPHTNTAADGFTSTAPSISYAANGYGLYNLVGNVWEWTADPFRVKSLKKTARKANAAAVGSKLLKGGSFLCHKSYCYRYRIAARTGNTPDSSTAHTGFRVIYSAPPDGETA
jgi:formylglycine-generating enzyme required for sulfatase activity